MALINCPECGKQVSDRAPQCPHCGFQLQQPGVATPPPPPGMGMTPPPIAGIYQPQQAAPQQAAAPVNQEMSASQMICPNCKGALGPKDLLSKDWANCPHCHQPVLIGGGQNAFDDNLIIERIAKFNITKDKYHEFFMQWLMEHADVDVFDKLKVISQKRKYFWAREYGQATERVIFPLCKYGKDFFERLRGTQYMTIDDYEEHFNTKEMVPFNSENIREADEVIAKEQSASENRFEFSHTDKGDLVPTPAYYCLPVIEEVVEYNGQQYTFIGTASGNSWIYNFDNFPQAEIFQQSPKFTDMSPVTWLVFGIIGLILLLIVIGLFSQGFWSGVIGLVIMGVLAYFLGAIVAGLIGLITGGIDAIIRAIVNRSIRKKFVNRWKEIQEHKRAAAKQNFRLDLTYEVPEFPIP